MKLKDLPVFSFKAIGREAGYDVSFVNGRMEIKELLPHPWWSKRLSAKSSFCRAVVQSGLLTHRQMVHAALRYRLGRSKDDAVIFWQIDRSGEVYDGKLMWYGPDCHRLKNRNPTWAMYLYKKHYGLPLDVIKPQHCFFGTHLLNPDRGQVPVRISSHRGIANPDRNLSPVRIPVAVVEAEKTAVILSELYPEYIWLAAGGLGEVQVNKFIPLSDYRVILFPDTDPEGRAFTRWYEAAQEVMKSFFWPKNNPIRVSPFLELHATPDQKRRKIDLVDYYFEQKALSNN